MARRQTEEKVERPVEGDIEEPSKEKVIVHMKRYHHHGMKGRLLEGGVYKLDSGVAAQIERDFPGTLKLVSQEEGGKILEERRKKREKWVEKRRAEAEKRAREELEKQDKAIGRSPEDK